MDWLGFILGLGNLGVQAYGAYNASQRPDYSPSSQPTYQPPQIEFPDYSEYFKRIARAYEGALQRQANPPQDPRAVARSYAGARGSLQERGVTTGGAITPEALQYLFGPDTSVSDIRTALAQYPEYGYGLV